MILVSIFAFPAFLHHSVCSCISFFFFFLYLDFHFSSIRLFIVSFFPSKSSVPSNFVSRRWNDGKLQEPRNTAVTKSKTEKIPPGSTRAEFDERVESLDNCANRIAFTALQLSRVPCGLCRLSNNEDVLENFWFRQVTLFDPISFSRFDFMRARYRIPYFPWQWFRRGPSSTAGNYGVSIFGQETAKGRDSRFKIPWRGDDGIHLDGVFTKFMNAHSVPPLHHVLFGDLKDKRKTINLGDPVLLVEEARPTGPRRESLSGRCRLWANGSQTVS